MLRRVFFLFFALIISLPSLARQSCEWPFRTQIDVQENSVSGSQLQSYQVEFEVDASTLSSDYDWSNEGQDLYIYDTDDQSLLEFWIESWDPSAKKAVIWVRFPTLDRGQIRTIYFYYGNKDAPAIADVPFTFNYPGIKFHTRFSTSNPNSLSQARSAFDASNDRDANYGCGFITNFDRITNRSQFGNANNDFAAFSESYFLVKPGETGRWKFRYGADFGRGGALYIDGKQLEQQWGDNLWWANSWTQANQVLQGGLNLNGGYHKLEVLGFEDCCDGGITVQYKKPGGEWTTFSTDKIDIRSRACPVEQEPTFTVENHDVCKIDLGFDSSLSYPNGWVADDSRPVSFAIENLSTTHSSLPETRVSIVLGAGLSLSSSLGNYWSCNTVSSSASSTELSCLYNIAIPPNAARSSLLTLNIFSNNENVNTNVAFSATVFSKQFETQLDNNKTSATLPVWLLVDDITPTCSSTNPGVFSRFYTSQGYSDDSAGSKAEFDRWENDLAIRAKLYGKTVLSQINSDSGNPFATGGNNSSGNNYYLALLEGYLYAPEDGNYILGIDGDDAVEFQLNDAVYSSWYNPHGAQNSPYDENSVGLAKGFHKLNYRMQERDGGNSFYAYWRKPSDPVTTIIPTTAFFHCAGKDDIRLNMTIDIQDNPNTPNIRNKAIPGAILRYNIVVTNEGNISTNGNSMELIQTLSRDARLYVNNLSANGSTGEATGGPIIFTDGSANNTSGLSYNFISLNSTNDSLSFSNNSGTDYNYIPTADSDGFDTNITHIKLVLSGNMKPKYNFGTPNFTIEYQVKVK
ncbi:MAG: CCXG family PEP-CTERM protein [Oleispira antarctica]|nr:CCXG family PEP-CTERM protein [Oleispira antarctica]MBQ0791885.1 CCXG family PEP-CTERM protein [Oleispira antarctica]